MLLLVPRRTAENLHQPRQIDARLADDRRRFLRILGAQFQFYPEQPGGRERRWYRRQLVQAPRLRRGYAHPRRRPLRWAETRGGEFLLPQVVAQHKPVHVAPEDDAGGRIARDRDLREEADVGAVLELFQGFAIEESDLRSGDT